MRIPLFSLVLFIVSNAQADEPITYYSVSGESKSVQAVYQDNSVSLAFPTGDTRNLPSVGDLNEDFPEIMNDYKLKIIENYDRFIRQPMMIYKDKDLK